MRFCFADPPYPGMAHFYPEKTEVDHRALVAQLEQDYPDGWALCTASVTLAQVLNVCPARVRVMSWVKPFASFKPGVGVAYAWEPVLVAGGRPRTREQMTVRDWFSANITLRKGPVGAKPREFCWWVLSVLNVQHGDEVVDLYPGTGVMGDTLEDYLNGPLFRSTSGPLETAEDRKDPQTLGGGEMAQLGGRSE